MPKSSPDRYGAIPITTHWLTALIIVLALGSGFQAGNALDAGTKAAFLRIHIPAAIIVFLMTAFRIVWWWFFDKKPEPVRGSPLWQERTARGVHLVLYVVILGMVASGIGMMVLSGAGPVVFGGGAGTLLPDFHRYAPRVPHGLGANLLLALLFIHVAAALYHQFIRHDGSLGRMWYRR
jgi:cytochrome b561